MEKKRNIVKSLIISGFLSCLLISFSDDSFSQSIWTNPITGTNPNTANPYTTGQVFDPNITVSGIGRGPGAVGTNANDRYNANSWNTAAIDLTAYFEFTLTPNVGCEIDFTSFVYTGQASGTGPTSFALRSSVDGFVANIGAPTAGGLTISLAAAAYQNITTAITFRLYAWGASASGGTWSVNDFTFNGIVTCGCSGPVAQPTANVTGNNVTSIGCTSAQINWTASIDADNVIVVVSTGAISDVPSDGVSYTANANFGSGDELVLADGQFVVYNGSGTSVTVAGLTQGTTYNYAIFGYDGAVADCEENYLTGGVFGSFTTITGCSTPQINTVMYNSCNGSAEGTDELVVFENGSNAINVNDLIIDLPNTTWCNSGCGGNTIGNNATYVSDLNTMAGCALFVYADPIPAGATVIIFTGNPPSTVLDYSSQCGAPGAPFYVLFLNNLSTVGNFVNTGSVPKEIHITFAPGVMDSVTYIADNGPGNVDGATAIFDDAGNASYITSTDCVYPLSVRLISFNGIYLEGKNWLNWKTTDESELEKFEVQKSIDGINFEAIGSISPTNSSEQLSEYNFEDHMVGSVGLYYYRLKIYGKSGKSEFSNLISIATDATGILYFNKSIAIFTDSDTDQEFLVNIYSIHGALVYNGFVSKQTLISFEHQGIFIVEVPKLGLRQKIVCY